MSILIKGMEMPKSCVNCPIAFFDDEYTILHCPLTAEEFSKNSFIYKRSDKCPLVPVQPHGRLIDEDAFSSEMKERQTAAIKWMRESVQDHDAFIRAEATVAFLSEVKLTLDKMPTIIPGEEGE